MILSIISFQHAYRKVEISWIRSLMNHVTVQKRPFRDFQRESWDRRDRYMHGWWTGFGHLVLRVSLSLCASFVPITGLRQHRELRRRFSCRNHPDCPVDFSDYLGAEAEVSGSCSWSKHGWPSLQCIRDINLEEGTSLASRKRDTCEHNRALNFNISFNTSKPRLWVATKNRFDATIPLKKLSIFIEIALTVLWWEQIAVDCLRELCNSTQFYVIHVASYICDRQRGTWI